MSRFPVSPQTEDALVRWMEKLGIREADLEEQFVRSRGPGGQKVQKSSTCVLLSHRPSGIEIRAETARTQGLNRYYARKRLCAKLESQQLGEQSAEQKRIAKLRRQKRKRSKRAQEKILEAKRHQAEKKLLRQKPELD